MFRVFLLHVLGFVAVTACVAADASAPAKTWRITVEPTADGGQSVLATLEADAPIKSGFGEVTPRLVLRYRGGRTLAYVLFDTYLGSKPVPVRLRFGEGEPETQEWRPSNDGRALIMPGDGLAFIRRLKEASAFAVTVTPPKAEPVTAQFTPTEVDLVIKALLAAGISYTK